MNQLRDTILRHVNAPNYRAVKPKVIAKQLGLEGDDVALLKKTVKRLVKDGKLAFGPKHLVCSVVPGHATQEMGKQPNNQQNESSRHVVGTFRRMEGGFGFVRPEGTPASAGRDADIFVSAKAAGDAATGDLVRIRLGTKLGRMGKPEGRVIDIVERATNRFVGLYFEQGGLGLVQVDGKVFSNPIYVGDPGAKGARDDDKVVIEMVRFPTQLRDGEGVITEILGQRGEPGIDTMSIIHEFNLPGEFPEDVLEDARQQAKVFDEAIDPATGRRDFTGETVITIDPATARDFDDAISLTRLEGGHWRLGVHIADVSHFVEPGNPLDREAHHRATSVYLPDRVIPMLPEVISNNLASLQPDKVRYSVTALIEFTPDGVPVATEVMKSAIRSCRRFTYEEVDQYLADRNGWKSKLTPEVHALLGRMHKLAMLLRGRRMKRGALELSMPELEIELDRDGRVCGAHVEENTESHQIIEEFMLAANEAVARKLADASLLFLRRVHGSPDPRKLKAFTEFVHELGLETESLESRFALQELLERMHGDPRQHAVNYAALRSMQRAVYSPEEEGHYALASDCYCHFTSPIRRYPDLTIHRLIDALQRGTPPEQQMDALLALGDHCSEREGRATKAERELNKVKLLHYLEDKIGMEMEGVITGVERFGLFIMGTQLPAEGFVHISSLADDHYRYDRTGHVIEGFRSGNTYRLGDTVRVAVATVDVDSRELDFRLLARLGSKKRKSAPKKKGMPGKKTSPRKTQRRGKKRGR